MRLKARWDDADQRDVLLVWKWPGYSSIGWPNDEEAPGHRLWNKGLKARERPFASPRAGPCTCLDAYAHEVPIIRVVDRVPDAALLMCDEEAVLTPFQFFPDLGRDTVRPLGPRCTLAPHPFTSQASALPLDARLTAAARVTS